MASGAEAMESGLANALALCVRLTDAESLSRPSLDSFLTSIASLLQLYLPADKSDASIVGFLSLAKSNRTFNVHFVCFPLPSFQPLARAVFQDSPPN